MIEKLCMELARVNAENTELRATVALMEPLCRAATEWADIKDISGAGLLLAVRHYWSKRADQDKRITGEVGDGDAI